MENWPGRAMIIAVRSKGTRGEKCIDETLTSITSLRTCADALLRHRRDRWSMENSWHCPRDNKLDEDAHRYGESNGVQVMATLRSFA